MGIRTQVGKSLEAALGAERTNRVRAIERRYRAGLARRIAPAAPPQRSRPKARPGKPSRPVQPAPKARPLGEPNDRVGGWGPSDPFVPHPTPTLTRHDLLRELHAQLTPRTYLEIGVNEGLSLRLSRAKTVAVDPEFIVRHALHCDLDLVQAKSDDFFARPDPLAHLEGVPVDLAFIDGMHLSEYALRDFINVERHLAPTAVTVLDDVMPRNALEAARVRRTGAWAGDIYKVVEVISRHRPDLVVLLVNTSPTGTAVVVGSDPSSTVLTDRYPDELAYLEAEDPQTPSDDLMSRAIAVDPQVLLASPAWALLVEARTTGDMTRFAEAVELLRAVPRLG